MSAVHAVTAGVIAGMIAGFAIRSARSEPKRPGVVILCEDGGVYRKEAFLASAGPCVLGDAHGGHATADAIVVYDNGESPQIGLRSP